MYVEITLNFKMPIEDSGPSDFANTLRGVITRIEDGNTVGTIRDDNGNSIGKFDIHATS